MKEHIPRWLWAACAVASIFGLGLIDWWSGYELNFFVFYFIPVAAGAWFLGFIPALTLAFLSTLVWFGADAMAGHGYTTHAHAVWNTIIRLVSFIAIGWSVSTMQRALDTARRTSESLKRALSEIKVLEAFLPICAQCKKIRNQQGVWQHLEVYIGEHSNTQFSHGYCPECGRKVMEEAGLLDPKTDS